jgi:hypothetical protein
MPEVGQSRREPREPASEDTGVNERTVPSPGAGPGPRVDRSRLVLTGLLLVIVIIGVRAGFALTWQGGWRGPWHGRDDGIAMAVALELLCVLLLGALLVRYRRSPNAGSLARKLRIAMTWLVVAMMIALGAALVSLLHIHIVPHKPRNPYVPSRPPRKRVQVLTPHGSGPDLNLNIIKYVALAIAVLAVVALLVILLRRRQRQPEPEAVEVVDDGTALREAVEAGRRALGEVSEPRMAIIRCYEAMEHSLAEAGAARVAAETPDELLARSTAAGLLRGNAPVELTALFYEARFSTHPVPQSARASALQAIDTILADLSDARAKDGQAPAGSVAAP